MRLSDTHQLQKNSAGREVLGGGGGEPNDLKSQSESREINRETRGWHSSACECNTYIPDSETHQPQKNSGGRKRMGEGRGRLGGGGGLIS